jgi:HEAT repeat protein
MSENKASAPATALLLISPGCPHCAAVLQGLGELIKDATLARLEVINLAADPAAAERYAVRSVPWVRIGDFEFTGLLASGELRRWAGLVNTVEGWTSYALERLRSGDRQSVETLIERRPERIEALADLLRDESLAVDVRVGTAAVFEEFAGTDIAARAVPALARLAGHPHPTVRADAVHLLGLTRAPAAEGAIRTCLNDTDPQVREIAAEALTELGSDPT